MLKMLKACCKSTTDKWDGKYLKVWISIFPRSSCWTHAQKDHLLCWIDESSIIRVSPLWKTFMVSWTRPETSRSYHIVCMFCDALQLWDDSALLVLRMHLPPMQASSNTAHIGPTAYCHCIVQLVNKNKVTTYSWIDLPQQDPQLSLKKSQIGISVSSLLSMTMTRSCRGQNISKSSSPVAAFLQTLKSCDKFLKPK